MEELTDIPHHLLRYLNLFDALIIFKLDTYILTGLTVTDLDLSDTKYTALIPMDDAFQRWHPIDWGFNPFNVKPFLRRTLLDHFVVGEVDPSQVSEGDEFQTVGGRNVTFTSGDGGPGRMKIRWVQSKGRNLSRFVSLFVWTVWVQGFGPMSAERYK